MNEIEKAIEAVKVFKKLNVGVYGLTNHLDTILTALEAQQANRWIPIKSEMDNPLENGDYQVTVRYKNFAGVYIKTSIASCRGGKWTLHGGQPAITNMRVTAWKPLSEPWREEQP